jgi:hypothetical protein
VTEDVLEAVQQQVALDRVEFKLIFWRGGTSWT